MGVLADIWWALTHPFTSPLPDTTAEYSEIPTEPALGWNPPTFDWGATDGGTKTDAEKARAQLAMMLSGAVAVVGAPTLYAAYNAQKRPRKRKLTDKEIALGRSLENASTQATALIMTGLASPAISAVLAYLTIQKLEDGKVISGDLGNAAQSLLTVAAAGPAIQGIGQIVGSAFGPTKAGK